VKQIKLKSGGHLNVLSENEKAIAGEINFFEKEYEWAKRIAKDNADPESEREFWKAVIEKKKADSSYSLFTDFPKEEEKPRSASEFYATAIINMLKGGINGGSKVGDDTQGSG
jgi:hypothetical protein